MDFHLSMVVIKMDLQVKKLKPGISTNSRQNSLPDPYYYPHGNDKSLHPPHLRGRTMKTYFKMYCFKSTFLKHVIGECTFCCKVLLVTFSKYQVATITEVLSITFTINSMYFTSLNCKLSI